jgi:SAM-dependent methyltransferase
VIEHGLQPARLLEEMSRLLAPNGCFIASFDYWPEKVDTTGVRFFDMEWCIFSSDEVRSFVEKAAGYGFAPEGPLALDAGEPTVRYADRDYTFAWMALRKRGHGER